MAQFDVDFAESFRQLAEFQARVNGLGEQLDSLEGKSGKRIGSASRKLVKEIDSVVRNLTERVKAAGHETETLGNQLESATRFSSMLLSGMASDNLKATVRAQALNGEFKQMARLLNDTASKNTYSQWQIKTAQLTNKMAGENQYLKAAIKSLNTEEGRLNNELKATLATKNTLLNTDAKLRLVTIQQSAALSSLMTEQGRLNAINQVTLSSKKAEITETARLEAQLASLQRQLTSLNGGRQEEIAKVQAQIAARKAEIRQSQAAKKVIDELAEARRREEAVLTRLQAQMSVISSADGKAIAVLRRKIDEQTRYNRLLAMSTAELLGFSSAQHKANLAMMAGSQSGAMLRAALAGAHTSIGMYTSGTVLAAAATYGLVAAIRSAITLGSEFTASLARTGAIMSTGQPAWMADTGAMAAMEDQVRSLGQTTSFTASEVAGGLSELGMAGLSASDAILALRPALNLAMLGNIDMARSSDIATNVMMTFGKTAMDLTDIVDVMATAVNSSNTNIEQLANALTYAGPAAQTAGISMRDTVAAVEALANSGIKASRAGTALRRFFVSILNPTSKGAAMLDKYSISVLDAEGNTRGLVDIVGQLSNKLGGLSGAERLGAIQNLVGVYATSPIAALVEQHKNLVLMRKGLDDVSGAAERMKAKIEDSLKYDWKNVLSAFEEVQLQAYDSQEMRLREASARITSMLMDLTKPISDGSTITQLDVILQRTENIATALAQMAAGYLAFKAGSVVNQGMVALSTDTAKLGTVLGVLRDRFTAANLSATSFTATSLRTSATLQLQAARTFMASGALNILAVSGRTAATALNFLMVAAGAAARALGWVGLIWGIWEAVKSAFGSDVNQDIMNQKAAINDLTSSYQKLKDAAKEAGLARERQSLVDLNTADKNSLEGWTDSEGNKQQGLYGKRDDIEQAIQHGDRRGEDTSGLKAYLASTNHLISESIRQIGERNTKLDQMKATELDLMSANERQLLLTNRITQAEVELGRALSRRDDTSGVAKAQLALRFAKQQAEANMVVVESVRERTVSMRDLAEASNKAMQDDMTAELADKQATAAEKLAKSRQQVAAIDKELAALHKANEGVEAGVSGGLDTQNRLLERKAELLKEQVELQIEERAQMRSLEDAREALADFHRTDAERLTILRDKLAEVNAQQWMYKHLQRRGEAGMAAEFETERLNKELELLRQIGQITRSNAKSGKAGETEAEKAKKKAEAELKAAMSVYEQLEKKIDPAAAAMRELEDSAEKLKLLLGREDGISQGQYAAALAHLNKEHYEAALSQDKHYQALTRLREAYFDSPFDAASQDVAELNRLLDKGAVSLQHYNQLHEKMKKAQIEKATNGLPTANLNVGESSSSPFTDWVSTEMERAAGLAEFEKRFSDISSSSADRMEQINQQQQEKIAALNAQKLIEQGLEEQHQQKMVQIQQEGDRQRLAAQEQFGAQYGAVSQKQSAYAEQMGTMAIISAMGAAENLLGMFASAAEGASTAQKAAFVAQKTLAVAQIIMYTELAAAQAMTIPGDSTKVMGMSLAGFIRATGYANAGLVAGMAINELAGGGSGTQMYDTGGFIPYNRTGIAGEYGPELISGPAHVRGRGSSAAALGGGGGGDMYVTLSPTVVVQGGQGGSGGISDKQARETGEAVKNITMSVLREAVRPNGFLDNWRRSAVK